MAVPERDTDVPALRSLAESTEGCLSTAKLRERVQAYFSTDIGQWNILSNRDNGRNVVHLEFVKLQIKNDEGEWVDFRDRLLREGQQPEQRLCLTERGRLLLAGLPEGAMTVPDNYEDVIRDEASDLNARIEEASEWVAQLDEANKETAPAEGNISDEPPRAPMAGDYITDPEARRQANERRKRSHHVLVIALKQKAMDAGLRCTRTKYADALVRTDKFGAIFEMKSVEDDLTRQVRGAIAQLYHYRFLHRKTEGFEHHARLYGVFDIVVPQEMVSFLREINIGSIWYTDRDFYGDPLSREELPWLFQ